MWGYLASVAAGQLTAWALGLPPVFGWALGLPVACLLHGVWIRRIIRSAG